MKKLISIFMCFVMIFSVSSTALATSSQYPEKLKIGEFEYSAVTNTDGSIVVQTIKDGQKYNEARYEPSSGKIFFTEFMSDEKSSGNKATKSEVYLASDIVKPINGTSIDTPYSTNSTPNFAYTRSVMYNLAAGQTTNNILKFYHALVNYYDGDYTLNAAIGTPVSACLAALMAAFVLPVGIVYSMLSAAAGVILGDYLTAVVCDTVHGDIYEYMIKAVDPASSRTRYYEGTHVQSTVTDLQTGTVSTESYNEDITPQLIWTGNSNVAYWPYSDFWPEQYPGVYRWFI